MLKMKAQFFKKNLLLQFIFSITGQIKNCLALQAQTDTVLAHVASHLRSQKDLCDRAFDRRIDEVKKAKLLLEKQLSETIVKIGEVEESIKSVERGIAAKQVSDEIILKVLKPAHLSLSCWLNRLRRHHCSMTTFAGSYHPGWKSSCRCTRSATL